MYRLLLLFFFVSAGLGAQEEVIRDFIKEHRKGEENVAVKVPGWMISLASDIGATAADDEDEKIVFRLLGELGTARVVTFLNEDFPEPQHSVGNLLYSLERYHDFERWAEVRAQSGERVTLSVRYRNKKIRNLIAIVTEEDRTTMLSARAHLSAEQLGEMVNQLEEL